MLEYPTQIAKFNGVFALDLHFVGNFGADHSEINFIGLKGDFTEARRICVTVRSSHSEFKLTCLWIVQRKRQAVEAVYESQAMPSDHKVPGPTASGLDGTRAAWLG